MQETCADRGIRDAIEQDEAAEIAAFAVGFEYDRPAKLDRADANVIELEFLGGDMLDIYCDPLFTLGRQSIEEKARDSTRDDPAARDAQEIARRDLPRRGIAVGRLI